MNLGTASHLLRRNMMFQLVTNAGLNRCLKCEKLIETPEELSMDHIKPWRNVSSELFWDLDNIAFSHRKCNKADRPYRRESPEGMSWCTTCKDHLPIEKFGLDSTRWNGLLIYCRTCDVERQRRYDAQYPRYKCTECGYWMRKKCRKCGFELSMAEYMALRRKEGATY